MLKFWLGNFSINVDKLFTFIDVALGKGSRLIWFQIYFYHFSIGGFAFLPAWGSIFLLSRRASFHLTLSFHMTKLHWNDSVMWNDALRDSRKMDPYTEMTVSGKMTLFMTVEKWTLRNPVYDRQFLVQFCKILVQNTKSNLKGIVVSISNTFPEWRK